MKKMFRIASIGIFVILTSCATTLESLDVTSTDDISMEKYTDLIKTLSATSITQEKQNQIITTIRYCYPLWEKVSTFYNALKNNYNINYKKSSNWEWGSSIVSGVAGLGGAIGAIWIPWTTVLPIASGAWNVIYRATKTQNIDSYLSVASAEMIKIYDITEESNEIQKDLLMKLATESKDQLETEIDSWLIVALNFDTKLRNILVKSDFYITTKSIKAKGIIKRNELDQLKERLKISLPEATDWY